MTSPTCPHIRCHQRFVAGSDGSCSIVVACGCGREYTLEEYRGLHYVGEQFFDDDGSAPPRLEYRDCACGSTRCIWTDMDGNHVSEEPTS